MDKYKIIIFLTFHENLDALKDSIANIKHFLPNCPIIIHNGSQGDISGIDDPLIHVAEQKIHKEQFDSMIPMHIFMTDQMKNLELQSEYILLLSSNQLLVKGGFTEFMTKYKGSFFKRQSSLGCQPGVDGNPYFMQSIKDLQREKFIYQSNHDGMFFLYDDWIDMMDRCEPYRNINTRPHHEEWMYVGYLLNKYEEEELAEFSQYSVFLWLPEIPMDKYEEALRENKYLVKRVLRDINSAVRKRIREDNGYSP